MEPDRLYRFADNIDSISLLKELLVSAIGNEYIWAVFVRSQHGDRKSINYNLLPLD